MMKKPFIAGNWKMYKTGEEALELVDELKGLVESASGIDIVVAPTFTALALVAGR